MMMQHSTLSRCKTVQHHQSFRPCRQNRRSLHVTNLFTGIVQGIATVAEVNSKVNFVQMQVAFPAGKMAGIQIGASVAINGTCLTVTDILKDGSTLAFDIIIETLRATNLGTLQPGGSVNFERSARIGEEVGGHNVSGHVHTKACISNITDMENNRRVTFELPDSTWMKYILPKGYIAVDGTSLTIGEVTGNTFSVYLIPETLRATVHGVKTEGEFVNIEIETQTQAIVDTVERVMAKYLANPALPQ